MLINPTKARGQVGLSPLLVHKSYYKNRINYSVFCYCQFIFSRNYYNLSLSIAEEVTKTKAKCYRLNCFLAHTFHVREEIFCKKIKKMRFGNVGKFVLFGWVYPNLKITFNLIKPNLSNLNFKEGFIVLGYTNFHI